jgi:hypothetical protein
MVRFKETCCDRTAVFTFELGKKLVSGMLGGMNGVACSIFGLSCAGLRMP